MSDRRGKPCLVQEQNSAAVLTASGDTGSSLDPGGDVGARQMVVANFARERSERLAKLSAHSSPARRDEGEQPMLRPRCGGDFAGFSILRLRLRSGEIGTEFGLSACLSLFSRHINVNKKILTVIRAC